MIYPAATEGSQHTCPKSEGSKPHIGGPALKGSTNVTFANRGALRIGDPLQCNGPIDKVKTGSSTVTINSRPAARANDTSEHGGRIVDGINSILIG